MPARAPPHRRILSITRRRRIFFYPLLPLPLSLSLPHPFSLLMPFFCDRDTRHRATMLPAAIPSRARRNHESNGWRIIEHSNTKLKSSSSAEGFRSKEWWMLGCSSLDSSPGADGTEIRLDLRSRSPYLFGRVLRGMAVFPNGEPLDPSS